MKMVTTKTLGMNAFLADLQKHLPLLIEGLKNPLLRDDMVWGKLFPFAIEAYGNGGSLGHCVRPDIVLSESGPLICELDFAPSGRGFALAHIEESGQDLQKFLDPFSRWYQQMGADQVIYGTATTTVCWEETQFFAQKLRDLTGTQIIAANLDQAHVNGHLVDRLAYRSEFADSTKSLLTGKSVITAEPHLDSKLVFALMFSKSAKNLRKALFPRETIEFFQAAFPRTLLVSDVGEARIMADHKKWVLKNTEVETDYNWGCRGTMIGASETATRFSQALQNGMVSNGRKQFGENPVVQEFHQSRDFWFLWNHEILAGHHATVSRKMGKESEDFHVQTRHRISARIGVYCLVVSDTTEMQMPPYALVTLRAGDMVHGANDAVMTVLPFE